MKRLLSIFVPANRTRLLIVAGCIVVAIAIIDWLTKPYLSLGFLYLFPIIIVGGFFSRTRIIMVALVCAILQEAFSNLPENEAIFRLVLSSIGFSGTGLFISELLRNRRITLEHVEELESEVKLRRDAEGQLQVLVESSPAAIVTIVPIVNPTSGSNGGPPENLPLVLADRYGLIQCSSASDPDSSPRGFADPRTNPSEGEAFMLRVEIRSRLWINELRAPPSADRRRCCRWKTKHPPRRLRLWTAAPCIAKWFGTLWRIESELWCAGMADKN